MDGDQPQQPPAPDGDQGGDMGGDQDNKPAEDGEGSGLPPAQPPTQM